MFHWRKQKVSPAQQLAAQPIYHWGDEEIPRYPPFMKGLPVVPPDRLLDTQQELLTRIANTSIATPDIFERHYMGAMQRFASFAHLLPASQSHHHRGAGGLLRHALEVGLWGMQSADRVLLDAAKTPAQRREMEPRWQLTVFLAGMCHDAGKPVTDLTVTDKDRTTTWSPITEDLFAWATRRRINAYFLAWREGRARQHTALSSLIGERIIGTETLAWIAEAETELVVWLMESLAGNPSPTNRIHDLVIKADQTSVERDLKTLGVAMAGYDLGVPVERHLTDIMRRLVREKIWLINEPGARLWNIGGHIYLVWPAAGEDLARQVREDGVPGIARTPDGILDMLVERQIAYVREGVAPGDRLWKIAPAVLAEKIPEIKLPAIRLRDEAMVSSMPITPIEGRIVNEPEHAWPQGSQGTASPVKFHEEQWHSPPDIFEPNAKENGQNDAPVTQKREGDGFAQGQDDADASARIVPMGAAAANKGKPLEAIKPDGAVGEALKALAQDLKAGDKTWGRDAVADAEGQVCLKWPDAFAGYGLTAKAILDELHGHEWLWIDPMTPLKKVMDAEFKAGVAKAIRLAPAISRWLIKEARGASAIRDRGCCKVEVNDTAPKEFEQQRGVPVPEKASSGAKSANQGRKPTCRGTNHTDVTHARQDLGDKTIGEVGGGIAVDQGNETAVASTGTPSAADVIASIKDLPAQVHLDGYCVLAKAVVMSACKKHGVRITHRKLSELSQQEPERLHVDGDVVRYRA